MLTNNLDKYLTYSLSEDSREQHQSLDVVFQTLMEVVCQKDHEAIEKQLELLGDLQDTIPDNLLKCYVGLAFDKLNKALFDYSDPEDVLDDLLKVKLLMHLTFEIKR